MRIRVSGEDIVAVGEDDQIRGVDTFAVVSVPEDFIQTFSVGKYKWQTNQITEQIGWVPPENPPPV